MIKVVESPQLSDADVTEIAQEAVQLAGELLQAAQMTQTGGEKRQAAKIGRMLTDPAGKQFTIAMSDRAFRSKRAPRAAKQIEQLLKRYGTPRYLAAWERMALKVGAVFGRMLPQITVPQIANQVRRETERVILPGEDRPLTRYISQRTEAGIRLNLNQLGEAILGEGEAERRLQAYLQLLKRPDVNYISVKISSIFSQINMAAIDWSAEQIKDRLRTLYAAAQQHNTFVNLDMEEYRDLHLTVRVFQELLDEPQLHTYRAGIVLQAYLPDSHAVQQELTAWAQTRVANGGAPIKLRIVKGANLAMEQVEASIHHWEQTPYRTKPEVDANYKRMVLYGMTPEHARAVNLGIASHNLFDIAFALLLRERLAVHDFVEFEMLEGMANHQARIVQQQAGGVLLYAPVVRQEDFDSAISYLVRRLDENTAPENFLSHLFDLEVGSAAWQEQADRFLDAVERRDQVATTPNRQQNRQTELITFDPHAPFANVADTDFSLPANQAWAASIIKRWQQRDIPPIPLMIAGTRIATEREANGYDPADLTTPVYSYSLATPDEIELALETAHAAQAVWQATSAEQRKVILSNCATTLASSRSDLIGAMMVDGGKTIQQADSELSEAIDFANYYGRAFEQTTIDVAHFRPLGTILITPPWNFPLAIPAGGVFASLMAGNTVILKPAPEAVLVAWELCQRLWQAGVPADVLQFVPTTDDTVGQSLVTDDRIDGVILTGSYETARLFQSWKPHLNLMAETSGKNNLIITALADRDQAIKDLVYSAFGHNGQKCSAASLAILEAEVYDDPAFRRQLADAAASWAVGTQWQLENNITPLTQAPSTQLKRGLHQLDDGETWLLEPRRIAPNQYTPGIRLGVRPNSFFHKTECFGPVLGLVRADNLDHAIAIANDSEFGLTGGIHSLDPREVAQWQDEIEIGNAYVNRPTTGAIVQRQPFGGWKKSAFGSGAKAGGPNYVHSLGTWHNATGTDLATPSPQIQTFLEQVRQSISHQTVGENTLHSPLLSQEQFATLQQVAGSYAHAWLTHYSVAHDPSKLHGEDNLFRYRPMPNLVARFSAENDLQPILHILLAAMTCQADLTISLTPNHPNQTLLTEISPFPIHIESEVAFRGRLPQFALGRLRGLGRFNRPIQQLANKHHIATATHQPLKNGRLELRHYLREQAISVTTHRYGNVFDK